MFLYVKVIVSFVSVHKSINWNCKNRIANVPKQTGCYKWTLSDNLESVLFHCNSGVSAFIRSNNIDAYENNTGIQVRWNLHPIVKSIFKYILEKLSYQKSAVWRFRIGSTIAGELSKSCQRKYYYRCQGMVVLEVVVRTAYETHQWHGMPPWIPTSIKCRNEMDAVCGLKNVLCGLLFILPHGLFLNEKKLEPK